MKDLLRRLPSVESLLSSEEARGPERLAGRAHLTRCVREVLDECRLALTRGEPIEIERAAIWDRIERRLLEHRAAHLRRVINATGVILHTGLGRAVLPTAVLEALQEEQRGYSLLEIDAETGERSKREAFVAGLVREITGAEAATIVNNNAGATLLALATLAPGREVIVSRGQLVEIGGSFRIPEVMEQSGAKLIEVGTTNKTHLADYERKIRPETALLLRVHPSNFRIVGFTHTPSLAELVALGRKHRVPVMDDLGSGAFVDLAPYGIQDEPTVQESVRTGADVVTFSGDKLLGGPQAGILVGRRDPIDRIRRHPLFRALRVDKLQLTALEATLKLYREPDRLVSRLPTLRMIAAAPEELESRAIELAGLLKGVPGLSVEILDDSSEVGGGSVPAHRLPTKVVGIRHASLPLDELAARLRIGAPPVFARVQRDRLLFDVRTLQEGEAEEVRGAVERVVSGNCIDGASKV